MRKKTYGTFVTDEQDNHSGRIFGAFFDLLKALAINIKEFISYGFLSILSFSIWKVFYLLPFPPKFTKSVNTWIRSVAHFLNLVTFRKVDTYLNPSRPTTSLSSEEKEFQMVERHFQKMTLSSTHYISSIEFINNSVLQKKFDAKKEKFKSNGIPYEEIWAYHGTHPCNVLNICINNLSIIKRTSFGHGYYFSEFPEYSENYGKALILFKILPGGSGPSQIKKIPKNDHAQLETRKPEWKNKGYIWVIPKNDQFVPYCVISLEKNIKESRMRASTSHTETFISDKYFLSQSDAQTALDFAGSKSNIAIPKLDARNLANTKVLMIEYKRTISSEAFKSGYFDVALVNDNLYEWQIKIFKVDSDSNLAADLGRLKENNGQDYVLLSFTFPEDFPFKPPFVRVISPVLDGGFITKAGAVCLELLTPQGWFATYSIESIIIQLGLTLVQGEARINFETNPKHRYTMLGAEISFQRLMKIHQKHNWKNIDADDS